MKIELDLSPDKMRAYIRISLDENEDSLKREYIDSSIIYDYLEKNGIIYGIKELPKSLKIGEKYLVAEGKPPVPGKDARIELFHNVDKEIKPKILEDGRVDYRELDVLVIVKKGDVVARRLPPTLGSPGINVKGETIPSRPGRDENLLIGLNIATSDLDKNIFVSTVDGQLVEEDGKLSVFPLYEIKGNLDFSVGNIKFPGAVVIRRNIKSGFKVEAKGKVEVYESAEECDIITEGDIVIKKSYIGKGKSVIKAGGSVSIGFIETANIEAKKDVISYSAIMHSNIKAGQNIIAEGKGIISGGELVAGESIVAKIVGSKFGTETILKIAKPANVEKKIADLRKKIMENEYLVDQLNTKVRALKVGLTIDKLKALVTKKQLNLLPNQMILINRFIETYDIVTDKIKEMKKELELLDLSMEKFKKSVIIVRNTIYSGAVIVFGDLILRVKEPLKFAKFYIDENEVKIAKI